MKPGIYRGLSDIEYNKIDGLRASTIKGGGVWAQVRYEMEHPKADTEAMDFGSALHYAMLEPHIFNERVIKVMICDDDGSAFKDFRTKKARAARDAFYARHADKVTMDPVQYNRVLAVRDALERNEWVANFLKSPGQNELTIVWDDEIGNLRCKAKLDLLRPYEGYVAIGDIKTAESADPEKFSRACANYGYDIQEAMYRRAMRSQYPDVALRFFFIVVEKTPPYLSAVYEIDQDDLATAQGVLEQKMTEFGKCWESGVWPGYPLEPMTIAMPKWARRGEG